MSRTQGSVVCLSDRVHKDGSDRFERVATRTGKGSPVSSIRGARRGVCESSSYIVPRNAALRAEVLTIMGKTRVIRRPPRAAHVVVHCRSQGEN